MSVATRSRDDNDDRAPRLLCIGAHPDDCEDKAGGLAALWTARGGVCRLLAVTDGSSGHHQMAGAALARRRAGEAAAAAAVLGADSVVLDNQDGYLMPSLENRHKVIRAIREFAPDVIVTHRTNDYHPDHRYTGVLVQDSCYLVMVPNVVPTTPTPPREPVVIFMYDRFTRPSELRPDIVLDIDGVMETKLDSFMCHQSQVEEWMPWMYSKLQEIPDEPIARRDYLRRTSYPTVESQEVAHKYRDALVAKYGADRGAGVQNAEAFEISEYAGRLDDKRSEWLFPF